MTRTFQLFCIGLLAAATFVGAACGNAPAPSAAPVASATPSATLPQPTPESVEILTEPAPAQACMDALAQGTLVPDPRSGLGISSPTGERVPVMWPFGYSAILVDGEIELLDADGISVAREGDTIQMGGGSGPGGMFFACAGSVTRVAP